jgi:hypothetical protein
MSESAFQKQFRQEFIHGFEQTQALLRQTVTTEAVIKGNEAVFLVADSGDAEAVTRGLNGLIPGRPDNNAQPTALLREWHDKPIKTGFNIFASQGDQKRIMQLTSMGVINRKIDQDIIGELNTATQTTGTAEKFDLNLAMYATTILGNNEVDTTDGNLTFVITPAAFAYLMQTKEFTSVDWVNNKPFSGQPAMFRWANYNWIVHPRLPGKGTNAEKCFAYHKNAIGHGIDVAGIKTNVGYNAEDDYSFNLCTVYMGSKVLQNKGIVIVNHDGSGFAPVAA